MILFLVSLNGRHHCVVNDINREGAKRKAHAYMGGNADRYIVTPLTTQGDSIYVAVTVEV